jgi:hypothetical protein
MSKAYYYFAPIIAQKREEKKEMPTRFIYSC